MRGVSARGFTLVELLVAMSLLSVIMVALISAIRTMAQSENRIDQRIERQDEYRVARSFLLQALSRISAVKIDVPNVPGKKEYAFKATASVVSWVGVLPARPDVGGQYFFRLELEAAAQSNNLVLRFSPWAPDMTPPDWTTADMRVLVKDVDALEVQAQGLRPQGWASVKSWPSGWQAGWPLDDALPQALILRLTPRGAAIPEWIFSINALPQTAGGFGGVVIGGGLVQ